MDREQLIDILESTPGIGEEVRSDPSFLRTVAVTLPDGKTVTFRDLIDPGDAKPGAATARRVDHGTFVPHHEFRRIACSGCGGMHWEPRQRALAFRFCPRCGALFTGFESPSDEESVSTKADPR